MINTNQVIDMSISSTNYEVTLTVRYSLQLMRLINHLIDVGCFPFSYEMTHQGKHPEYHLTIEVNGTDVLIELLKLMPDYETEE